MLTRTTPINQLVSNPEPPILGEDEGIPDCLNTGTHFCSSEHFTTPLLSPKEGGECPLALWIPPVKYLVKLLTYHLSGSEHFCPVLPWLNGDKWWHGSSHKLSPKVEGSQPHTEEIFRWDWRRQAAFLAGPNRSWKSLQKAWFESAAAKITLSFGSSQPLVKN